MNKPKKFKLGPLQRKWLRALKSGKYKQTTGRLCRKVRGEYRYCCLGVACEVLRIKHETNGDDVLFDGCSGFLPEDASQELKLRDVGGEFGQGAKNSLSWINDQSRNFNRVIKIIETRPQDVFTAPA